MAVSVAVCGSSKWKGWTSKCLGVIVCLRKWIFKPCCKDWQATWKLIRFRLTIARSDFHSDWTDNRPPYRLPNNNKIQFVWFEHAIFGSLTTFLLSSATIFGVVSRKTCCRRNDSVSVVWLCVIRFERFWDCFIATLLQFFTFSLLLISHSTMQKCWFKLNIPTKRWGLVWCWLEGRGKKEDEYHHTMNGFNEYSFEMKNKEFKQFSRLRGSNKKKLKQKIVEQILKVVLIWKNENGMQNNNSGKKLTHSKSMRMKETPETNKRQSEKNVKRKNRDGTR